MKRSDINQAIRSAHHAFTRSGWSLPPEPRWDVTDFGLGRFREKGLVLVNLAEEPEYCEKVMFAAAGQRTPAHCHAIKKEDIIVRSGGLRVQVWNGVPGRDSGQVAAKVNGRDMEFPSGHIVGLASGERITMRPGIYHEFWASSDGCVIGEVSTANDDEHDNYFADPDIGRFPDIDEDEPPLARLLSEPEASS
jgi:D-lyxose ketol-isomerase